MEAYHVSSVGLDTACRGRTAVTTGADTQQLLPVSRRLPGKMCVIQHRIGGGFRCKRSNLQTPGSSCLNCILVAFDQDSNVVHTVTNVKHVQAGKAHNLAVCSVGMDVCLCSYSRQRMYMYN